MIRGLILKLVASRSATDTGTIDFRSFFGPRSPIDGFSGGPIGSLTVDRHSRAAELGAGLLGSRGRALQPLS